MTLYLDTETTGLNISDRLVEIGVVDDRGGVVFSSLINPQILIPQEATEIHGITQNMVKDSPKFSDIESKLKDILMADGTVVIYNSDFDKKFFPTEFWSGLKVLCAYKRYAIVAGGRRKLERAAKAVGHVWTGVKHRAVADAQACRAVWQWMEAHGAASADRFTNLNRNELARRAWEAHLRSKEATAELKEIKTALIAAVKEQKETFIIPGVCKVSVSAAVDSTNRRTYSVDKDALALLDPAIRKMLFDLGVIKTSEKIGSTYHIIRFTDLSGSSEIDAGEA